MGEVIDTALRPTLIDLVPEKITPDHITFARALSLMPLMAWGDRPIPAIGILLFSSACDTLDGALARARKQTTDEGAADDALADKYFMHGAMLTVCYDRVNPTFVFGFIAVDLVIGFVRWLKRRRKVSLNSNIWGKRKTIWLTVAIGLVLTNVDLLATASIFAFVAALFCAIMSFVGHARELRSALPA